jgi:RNA polymerase sigma-32 factor
MKIDKDDALERSDTAPSYSVMKEKEGVDMNHALDISLVLPGQNLQAYKQSVQRFPILALEEEQRLAELLRDENDVDAAWRLVTSHLRFVVKIARGYNGYGLNEADLIQEGNVGLMKAVKRFDPTRGVRLVSFAVHWIRAEMHEYVLRNWRIVKVATTKAQRKLFFNLRSAKKRLGWLNQAEADSIAADLGVTTAEVYEMERRLSAYDEAYDQPVDEDSETVRHSPSAYLEDRRFDPADVVEAEEWENDTQSRVLAGMATLDDRSRDIIERRWMTEDKSTLHELAAQYSVSAERIRQIEVAAMKKLRGALEE